MLSADARVLSQYISWTPALPISSTLGRLFGSKRSTLVGLLVFPVGPLARRSGLQFLQIICCSSPLIHPVEPWRPVTTHHQQQTPHPSSPQSRRRLLEAVHSASPSAQLSTFRCRHPTDVIAPRLEQRQDALRPRSPTIPSKEHRPGYRTGRPRCAGRTSNNARCT